MTRRLIANRVFQVSVVALVLLAAVLGWLAYSALKVKDDLEAARDDASRARAAVLGGDQAGAKSSADAASAAARSASDRSHGIVWSAAAAIPWVGDPLRSVQQMSDVTADLAEQVLVPSAQLSDVLDPAKLRDGDAIDIEPLRAAQPELARVADASGRLAERVTGIEPSWLGMVADARTELTEQVEDANATVWGTEIAARLVPTMLGGDGPRNYLVAFQTPSEARGTGGLFGGFAVVNATDGRVTVPTLGANSVFEDPVTPQLNLGEDYDTLYGPFRPYTDYRNANLSPDFTDAAKIWIANWKEQTGQQLDGVLALDPIALSYVLEVMGPVTLPGGEEITADNVVPITLSTSYERFAEDNEARKLYLQSIAKAVVTQLASAEGDTGATLEALGRGVSERRIMLYSTRPQEQEILESTNLGHQISATESPYLQVALGNAAGNKLDYYLRREIDYRAGGCSGETRESTVTVRLTNTLDDLSLPEYVIGSMGTRLNKARGVNMSNVEFLTTKGSVLKDITVDGESAFYVNETLRGRPYISTRVSVPPGETVEVKVVLDEPTSAAGQAEVPVQPLVDDPTVTVDVPAC